MYSWDGRTDDWLGKAAYSYSDKTRAKRAAVARSAAAAGPRTYEKRRGPNEKVIDPRKHIKTDSRHPVVIAVDVTGSMASWPREIFDRLPLLYTTLAQYREDVEIAFAAIGDAAVDHWPLQVTTFASGFDLEQQLGSLFGEGGGGDAPESYGLFAYWMEHHVEAPNADERPFLIVFGDITMHEQEPADVLSGVLGDTGTQGVDAIEQWRRVAAKWNTWFLRRPGGSAKDKVHKQWAEAIGSDHVLHIDDELRAVDYAMAIVARSWGFFGDFQENMLARQDAAKVDALATRVRQVDPRPLKCPSCGAAIPVSATGRFVCEYCKTTVVF